MEQTLTFYTVWFSVFVECVVKGVGYHNAGLDYSDRRAIEELFLNADLLVLGTTYYHLYRLHIHVNVHVCHHSCQDQYTFRYLCPKLFLVVYYLFRLS